MIIKSLSPAYRRAVHEALAFGTALDRSSDEWSLDAHHYQNNRETLFPMLSGDVPDAELMSWLVKTRHRQHRWEHVRELAFQGALELYWEGSV